MAEQKGGLKLGSRSLYCSSGNFTTLFCVYDRYKHNWFPQLLESSLESRAKGNTKACVNTVFH